MPRRISLLLALVLMLALPAGAQARTLSMADAKALAAQKAEKVKRELLKEGAERAKVPGCWRKADHKIYCYFSVWGYDQELDFRWKCMLRVSVVLRSSGSHAVRYGDAVCG